MKTLLALLLTTAPAWAEPIEGVMANDKGAILELYGVSAQGFDFTLSSSPCPEGETTCLVVAGHAEATAQGFTYADGASRIFFASTPEGVKVLQTAGDLGSGTANRAAKLVFPGDYKPDQRAAAAMGDPGDGDAPAEGDAPQADYHAFQSPTGNIGCLFTVDTEVTVRCDLLHYIPSFTQAPQDCEFDWGGSFGTSTAAKVGELLCYSDTVLDPQAEILAYGASVTYGDVTCRSDKSGVTCENGKRHGFQISRKAQKVY